MSLGHKPWISLTSRLKFAYESTKLLLTCVKSEFKGNRDESYVNCMTPAGTDHCSRKLTQFSCHFNLVANMNQLKIYRVMNKDGTQNNL